MSIIQTTTADQITIWKVVDSTNKTLYVGVSKSDCETFINENKYNN